MLAIGRPSPVISEIDGPYVRITLLGGAPDAAVVKFVSALEPPTAANVDTLLLLEQLCGQGWTDAERAAPLLQRHPDEAAEAIGQLLRTHVDAQPVSVKVQGVPADRADAVRLSNSSRERLGHRLQLLGTPAGRDAMFVAWAKARGRISSTEAADLADITPGYANQRLAALAREGHIAPSRANRTGRGFHYVPAHG